jgi:hypothetical protein
MNEEIKQKLLNCFNRDKITLFDLTFNTNYLFYEEPENFEEYIDLLKGLKESILLNIIDNFNQ